LEWTYKKIVLREKYVLSHPFVFQWQDHYYLLPEAHTETYVRLYRATAFPEKWERECDILTGEKYISPTLVRHNDLWWLFTIRPGNSELRLFHARDFRGPWTEHPASPIVKDDPHGARPAGRPISYNGKLFRLAQDCQPTYGRQVFAFEIIEMSVATYVEKKVAEPVVKLSGRGWNSQGMHHVDAMQLASGGWFAVVDALGNAAE
jgi:hypothetical protein